MTFYGVKLFEMASAGLDGHFRGRFVALLCSKGYTECTKHNAKYYTLSFYALIFCLDPLALLDISLMKNVNIKKY